MGQLITLRQGMYFRVRDIPDPTDITVRTHARISDTYYDLWVNRGIQRIVRETLCLEGTATLTPDGTSSSFTPVGADAQNVAANYIGLRIVHHSSGVLKELAGGIEDIRIMQANNEIVGGVPAYYALWADKIWLDRIPGIALTLNFDYYKSPATLSEDDDEPDAPLNMWDDFIIASSMLVYADDEGDIRILALNERLYEKEKIRFMSIVEQKGKHQRRTPPRARRI